MIRKTKTIALPLKATSKVASICDEIKEKLEYREGE